MVEQKGFTLIEVVVVLAVVVTMTGLVVPLVDAARDVERDVAVETELLDIETALDDFYFDNARFPNRLDDPAFVSDYLLAGVDRSRIQDDWSTQGALYRYRRFGNPDRASIYSIGSDGKDRGPGLENLVVTVSGAAPGARRTRMRLRLIEAALHAFVLAGGSLTGDWAVDRTALGLGPSLSTDGFGTAFRSSAGAIEVVSAGADRRFGTGDDLTL